MRHQKRLYDRRAVRRLFAVGDWVLRYYTPAKKCKLDSAWVGPYLVISITGWALGIQRDPSAPVIMVHCQDPKKVPPPPGAVSWLISKRLSGVPSVPILGASTMHHTSQTRIRSRPLSRRGGRTSKTWLPRNHRSYRGSRRWPQEWMLRRPL